MPGPGIARFKQVTLPLPRSVRGRVVAGFGLLIVILAAVVVGSAWQSQKHQTAMAEMKENAATALLLEDAQQKTTMANLLLERYLVTGNKSAVPQIRSSMATVTDNLAQAIVQEQLRGEQGIVGVDDAAELERLDELVAGAAATSDTFEQVIALQRSGDQEGARQALGNATAEITAFGLVVTEAAKEERDEIPVLQSRADRTAELAFWLLIVSGATGVILGLAASVFIARSILKPLSSVESVALAVAGGDLEARAQATGPPELANLGDSLNSMADSLEKKIEELEAEVEERKLVEEEQQKLVSLVESSSDFIGVASLEGQALFVNEAGRELVGLNGPAEVQTKSMYDFLGEDDLPEFKQRVLPAMMQDGRWEGKFRLRHFNTGAAIPVEMNAFTINHPQTGEPMALATVSRDITERERTEEALWASEARYRTIFENVQDIFYRTDGSGILTELSPSVARYGYTQENLIGTSVLDVYEDPEQRTQVVNALIEHGEVNDYEIRLKTADGRVVDVSLTARILRNPDGTFAGSEGAIRDITERKQMERDLEQALEAERDRSRHDPLTGVLNHGAIVEELQTLLARHDHHEPCAVAMIDVDGMKATNDTYGHQVGDTVLTTVARALECEGAVLGRLGGDQFVAILPTADRPAAERYRRGVRNRLARALLADPESGDRVPVFVSIGLAIYPEEANTVADLIKLSDNAMYASRRQRPGRSVGKRMPLRKDDHAAKMVGELVPLLTAPGELAEKLRLVAHRLSVGASYDAVNFVLFAAETGEPPVAETFGIPEDLVQAWTREQRSDGLARHPIRQLLGPSRRPLLLVDIEHDPRPTAAGRRLLLAGGIRSGVVVPMMWQGQVIGALSVGSKRKAAFGPMDVQFIATIGTQVTAIIRTETLVGELRAASSRVAQSHEETVLLLAAAAEAHDRTTGLHLRGVRSTVKALARELGHSDEDASALGLAAVLHDVGKFRVPDSILNATGPLSGENWELMKRHTTWGNAFLTDRPGFELAATIARSHHERWDGSGYPDGLSGEDIPEAATIVSVADAFDAMTSERPYRKARTISAAVREIVSCSGAQFSPKIVAALERLYRHQALPPPLAEPPDQEAA